MYQIEEGIFYLDGVGEYRSHGILSPGGLCINDITTNRAKLEQFVGTLNRLGASQLHLLDMVIDFIG